MGQLKDIAKGLRDSAGLRRRVAVLEAEVQECRQLNLRLAELCDVMTELLLPAAARDEARLMAALERFQADLGDPQRWSARDQDPR